MLVALRSILRSVSSALGTTPSLVFARFASSAASPPFSSPRGASRVPARASTVLPSSSPKLRRARVAAARRRPAPSASAATRTLHPATWCPTVAACTSRGAFRSVRRYHALRPPRRRPATARMCFAALIWRSVYASATGVFGLPRGSSARASKMSGSRGVREGAIAAARCRVRSSTSPGTDTGRGRPRFTGAEPGRKGVCVSGDFWSAAAGGVVRPCPVAPLRRALSFPDGPPRGGARASRSPTRWMVSTWSDAGDVVSIRLLLSMTMPAPGAEGDEELPAALGRPVLLVEKGAFMSTSSPCVRDALAVARKVECASHTSPSVVVLVTGYEKVVCRLGWAGRPQTTAVSLDTQRAHSFSTSDRFNTPLATSCSHTHTRLNVIAVRLCDRTEKKHRSGMRTTTRQLYSALAGLSASLLLIWSTSKRPQQTIRIIETAPSPVINQPSATTTPTQPQADLHIPAASSQSQEQSSIREYGNSRGEHACGDRAARLFAHGPASWPAAAIFFAWFEPYF